MTARYFVLEDFGRVVKLDEGAAYVFRDGAWVESANAWAKVQGFDGADGREITKAEAERLIGEGRVDGERFGWTAEDFEIE